MKTATKLVGTAAFTAVTLGMGAIAHGAEGQLHIVEDGETLETISELYHVTTLELIEWNDLTDRELESGQELIVSQPEEGEAEAFNERLIVTTDRLNVRGGAGYDYEVLGTLRRDEVVTATAQLDGWYEIQWNDGVGFVSAEFVSRQYTRIVMVNNLNVRSGPGTEHAVLGTLGHREIVMSTDYVDGWYVFQHHGTTAYVYGEFLMEEPDFSHIRGVAAQELNVRAGAGTNYDILGHLAQDDILEIHGLKDGWYEIEFQGETGYVSADFVEEYALENIRLVSVDNVNIRTGPSTNYEVIEQFTRNTPLIVLAEQGDWYEIKHETAEKAYISAHLTTAIGGGLPSSEAQVAEADGFIWPTFGGVITSPKGPRWGRMHNGIDIAAPSDYTIIASKTGTVTFAGWQSGFGNIVILQHDDGFITKYAHLASIHVSVGQTILQGRKLGIMGTTGNSTGIHLHFEVHHNGVILDPMTVLPSR